MNIKKNRPYSYNNNIEQKKKNEEENKNVLIIELFIDHRLSHWLTHWLTQYYMYSIGCAAVYWIFNSFAFEFWGNFCAENVNNQMTFIVKCCWNAYTLSRVSVSRRIWFYGPQCLKKKYISTPFLRHKKCKQTFCNFYCWQNVGRMHKNMNCKLTSIKRLFEKEKVSRVKLLSHEQDHFLLLNLLKP